MMGGKDYCRSAAGEGGVSHGADGHDICLLRSQKICF